MGKYAYCGRARVDAKQLAMGIKVEAEHTKGIRNKKLARKIQRKTSCDHIAPEPVGEGIRDYYTRLLKMEREAKRDPKSHY
jgi:hypothetical protein